MFLRLAASALTIGFSLLNAFSHAADSATLSVPERLRSEPQAFAPIVTTLQRHTTVRILDEQRAWYKVETDGGRSGWVPRHSLQLDMPTPSSTTPLPSHNSAGDPSRLLPRSSVRASNHALLLTLDPQQARADGDKGAALARLLGVPDANIQQPPADSLNADGLRRALAALDARVGSDDRAFILLANPRSGCTEPLPSGEFSQFVHNLSRKTDKLVVLLDGANGQCKLPDGFNLLALHGPRGSAAALLGCLDGSTPASAAGGVLSGEEWRQCAQHSLDAKMKSGARLGLNGNAALAPAPGLASGTPTPRKLLQTLYAQRSERRPVSLLGLRGQYRGSDTISIEVSGPADGWLYLLAAHDNGFTLLHPSPAAPAQRFQGRQKVTLPAQQIGVGSLRLLALVSDSPRNFMRAGFGGAGAFSSAPADARSLRDLPLEVLGGDTSATCQRAETRNLGALQARQCSTAYGAALAELTITR